MEITNDKNLQKGSSIIIALVVVILVIFVLNHYGITFGSVWNALKNFFGI